MKPSPRARDWSLRAILFVAWTTMLMIVYGCNNLVRVDVDANVDASDVVTACTLDGNQCASREYCQFATGTCEDEGRAGVCTATPETCTEIFSPVCGCDGETYANSCFAMTAEVSIDHEGECQ